MLASVVAISYTRSEMLISEILFLKIFNPTQFLVCKKIMADLFVISYM